ncbi:MAG: hypothetical protein RR022_08000 [Angelakisella sp.]
MKNPKQYRPDKTFVNETPTVPPNYLEEVLENPDDIVLANGSTGLLPTPPMTEAQALGYATLAAVPPERKNSAAGKDDITAKEKQ